MIILIFLFVFFQMKNADETPLYVSSTNSLRCYLILSNKVFYIGIH